MIFLDNQAGGNILSLMMSVINAGLVTNGSIPLYSITLSSRSSVGLIH